MLASLEGMFDQTAKVPSYVARKEKTIYECFRNLFIIVFKFK